MSTEIKTEENVEQEKPQMLNVEVIIPQEVLDANEELSSLYNKEKKILTYELGSTTTKDFQTKLSELIKTSSPDDIVVFNPIIVALNYIQGFKDLKYDKKAKNEQEHIDAIKMIGQFNTATTTAGKTLKDPKNAYTKMVVAVEKLIKEESDNIKSALNENFKEYLDEKAEKLAAAVAKKDAVKNQIITDLSSENETNKTALANQKKATRKVEVENIINKIVVDVTEKVPTLNKGGLQTLRQELLDRKLEEVDTEDVVFEPVEKTVFSQAYARAILNAVSVVDMSIKSIEDDKTVETTATEIKVLKAATPSGFLVEDDDMPFAIPTEAPVVEAIPEPELIPLDTDEQKLNHVVSLLKEMTDKANSISTDIAELDFEDEALQKIQLKLIGSLKNIIEWSEKTSDWTIDKQVKYTNFLNK